MNTAKDIIKKLVDEMPETKAGEVIDFLLFLKSREESELIMEDEEEEEILELLEKEERYTIEETKKLMEEQSIERNNYT
ncbi:hypothetical protein [Tindallia californiensis]|uniref:DUF2281 domain-containing protein n=1 Tax=Tindallia californiensis TaxID=159292 RepID=A0A1H3PF34_9FIRM|nr:hypothetical protein [Tindallia californiensis]SDY99563.1 hypothetical protein SAMN05192546_106171 [Tindallia californiensis]